MFSAAWLFLALHLLPGTSAGGTAWVVDDPAWRSALQHAAGLPVQDSGTWWVIPPGAPGDSAALLLDGTEAGRIPSGPWDSLLALRDARPGTPAARLEPGFARPAPAPIWRSLFPDLDRLDAWTRVPEGVWFRAGGSLSTSSDSRAAWNRYGAVGFDLAPRPWFRWISLGGSWTWSGSGNGAAPDPVFPGGGEATWNEPAVRACLPGICWESRRSEDPLSPDLWSIDQRDTLIADGQAPWTVPSQRSGNWAHDLSLHLGALWWTFSWDAESWRGVRQEVSLRDLEAGSLRWGLLAGWDRSAAWTGFVAGIRPLPLPRLHLPGLPAIRPAWEPAIAEFRYHRLEHLQAGLSMRLRLLDDRTTPGTLP